MKWTHEKKLAAAIDAPLAVSLAREDTRVVERSGWFQVITPSAKSWLNEVILSRVSADEAERAIDDVIATYRANGTSVKWCVGPWTEPADFGERLARRGFRSWNVRGMGIETDAAFSAPAHAAEPTPRRRGDPSGVTIVEIGEDDLTETSRRRSGRGVVRWPKLCSITGVISPP